MLNHLQIRDFTLVEHLVIDLSAGMSAVTGETGAGKSLLVDALGLLLGDRADSGTIRGGKGRAEINASFDLEHAPAARTWLAEHDLDLESECLLRRVVSREGRSKAYINGSPQPLQALRELGELLVDIHGQHEHQSLLRRERQRELLDDYGGNQAALEELRIRYQDWIRQQRLLADLRHTGEDRDARLAFLRFQVDELDRLDLQSTEEDELTQELARLANAERLLHTTQHALGTLTEAEDVSVDTQLARAVQELERLMDIDDRLAGPLDLLNGALIQVREASDELRRYSQLVELDPGRLASVEQRLADIHEMARKHRVQPNQLPATLAQLQDELEALENSGFREEQLQIALAENLNAYLDCAGQLTASRTKVASEFSARVTDAMQNLGMPGGSFEVALEPLDHPTPAGAENVNFLVSANPGQAPKPLAKVASGGELSRISLAIQVIAARSARIPTLVFDEVDTGIGGGIAEVVGKLLRTLSDSRQILCVTHLPQVAALAHHHLHVSKHSDGQSTHTSVTLLDANQRLTEIARMLGGVELTNNALAHAHEMISRAGHP